MNIFLWSTCVSEHILGYREVWAVSGFTNITGKKIISVKSFNKFSHTSVYVKYRKYVHIAIVEVVHVHETGKYNFRLRCRTDELF